MDGKKSPSFLLCSSDFKVLIYLPLLYVYGKEIKMRIGKQKN